MVMMWPAAVELMTSMMAAKVVLLPEPVGPVTKTNPDSMPGMVRT